MTTSPTLTLAMRDLALLARRDPVATYGAIYDLVETLTAPSAEPFAKAARCLGLGISRALEDYARRGDEIAEMLAEEARSPELPLAGAA